MMVYEHDRLKMPGKRQIEKKNVQLIKLVSQPLTEVCAVRGESLTRH